VATLLSHQLVAAEMTGEAETAAKTRLRVHHDSARARRPSRTGSPCSPHVLMLLSLLRIQSTCAFSQSHGASGRGRAPLQLGLPPCTNSAPCHGGRCPSSVRSHHHHCERNAGCDKGAGRVQPCTPPRSASVPGVPNHVSFNTGSSATPSS
jgi:hypothetical protein